MSSRKGNIVALMDLVAQMEKTIQDQYLEKYRGQWSDEQIQETAQMVANGAIKYGMLRMDNNKKIFFDMQEWLQLDGETGPYLQYVHARICSLLEKGQFDWANLDHSKIRLPQKAEQLLLLKVHQLPDILAKSAESLKTLNLCTYLFELGKLFNSFYAECPVLNLEDEELKKSRLALCYAVKETMKTGLALLGIQAPNQM